MMTTPALPSQDDGAIYLTDLSNCLPESALSPHARRHTWQTVPYQSAKFSGTLLRVNEETAAPEITLPLNLNGRHAIYIGLYVDYHSGGAVMVKLNDDPAFSVIRIGAGWDKPPVHLSHVIQEVFWKEADLTGQDLHLGQVCARVGPGDLPAVYHCDKGKVAYIKLVPLSAAKIAALESDRQETTNCRLFAHNDAHGFMALQLASTAEDVYRELEPYRHTDFSRMYWEAGSGDLLYHFGKAGRVPTCDGIEDFERVYDRLHAESWRAYRDQGLNPFQLALDYTHEMGLEFHASYRPAGFFYPPPLDHWNVGGFYEKHPELRARERDGSQAPRIAYSYPATRQFVISLLREVATYPVDGICILYNRRPPLIGYEQPLLDGFMAHYGEDARQLDPQDPRWLSYRAIALTEFMRALRREMDSVSREQGRTKRLEISAIVSNRPENFLYGMDVETWIAEGLIDTLIPYTSDPNLNSTKESWPDLKDAEYFVSITRGTACKLSMSILPRYYSPEDYRRKAAALYGTGADYLFLWDSAGPHGRANYSASWKALRRLGHKQEIADWIKVGEPSLAAASNPMLKLGDYDLTYSTPG